MSSSKKCMSSLLVGLVLLGSVGLTGCQVSTGGQTLPSPTYLSDDVQYYPPGSEFKLSKEAAAMKAQKQDMALGQVKQP